MWGVSDPLRAAAWGEEGGSRTGVAHARLASLRCCDASADLNTGGTERRPSLGYYQTTSQALPARGELMRCWTERQRPRELNELKGGTVLPSLRSPTAFPL